MLFAIVSFSSRHILGQGDSVKSTPHACEAMAVQEQREAAT